MPPATHAPLPCMPPAMHAPLPCMPCLPCMCPCHACPLPCMPSCHACPPAAMHAPCHTCPLPCMPPQLSRMPPAMYTPYHAHPLPCMPPAMHAPHCGQNSWHTLLKILPCPHFIAGGKNLCSTAHVHTSGNKLQSNFLGSLISKLVKEHWQNVWLFKPNSYLPPTKCYPTIIELELLMSCVE